MISKEHFVIAKKCNPTESNIKIPPDEKTFSNIYGNVFLFEILSCIPFFFENRHTFTFETQEMCDFLVYCAKIEIIVRFFDLSCEK